MSLWRLELDARYLTFILGVLEEAWPGLCFVNVHEDAPHAIVPMCFHFPGVHLPHLGHKSSTLSRHVPRQTMDVLLQGAVLDMDDNASANHDPELHHHHHHDRTKESSCVRTTIPSMKMMRQLQSIDARCRVWQIIAMERYRVSVSTQPNYDVKIADLGNACWTYQHFTQDIQTRQVL
jgi:hypothetical protein